MKGEGYRLSKDHEGSGYDSDYPEPRYLVVGRVLGGRGLDGEIKVEVMTDFPDRFNFLQRVYLGQEARPYTVEEVRLRQDKRQVFLKLKGCSDRNAAQKLRGQLVQVPLEEAMPLGEEEYYVYQILGLTVCTAEGQRLGVVREVLFTGSNEVYVVRDGGREILIPALEDVVLEVDLEKKRLVVELPEGLI